MIICIVAGGEGTRLWPLSQPHRPKHLLSLVDDKSLLQNTYLRAEQLTDQIFVIPEVSHADEVAQQLPQLPSDHLFIEPGRRGSASCIMLALARLKKLGYSETESVVFWGADHHIVEQEKFLDSVSSAASSSEIESKITLVGVEPTYPATGFGYIELAKRLRSDVYEVASFHEKPSYDKAGEYLSSRKYLWNIALFAAPPAVFISRMQKLAPSLFSAYKKLAEATTVEEETNIYLALPSMPIETELIEKDPETLVVAGRFGWADLGSFGDLYEVLRTDQSNVGQGGLVEMLDCENSMVLGRSDRTIIAIGLKDVVIVDSPDGLLVVDVNQAQRVKEALANLRQRK